MSDHTPDANRNATDRSSTSDLFSCLAHTHRRLVLSRLLSADRALTVDDLVSFLQSRGVPPVDPDATPDENRRRLVIELRNLHLPKLADSGLIEYDGESAVATEAAERAEQYIHMAAQDEHLRLAMDE